MEKVIYKELLGQILKLETNQQEKVLKFIKELLEKDEMNKRAEAAEEDIKYDRLKSFEDFNSGFESWKAKKK